MRNIKLTLAYDGTDFHGWQIQPGQPTIQGALTDVLREVTQEEVLVHGAGRTDAGVHALGQVAHFKTDSLLAPTEFQRALNAMLPPAIRVVGAEEVALDFHARWHAAAKTYLYRICCGAVVPPFEWRYVLHHPHPLDVDAMAKAARLFEGEHDFTSFAASTGIEEDDRDRVPVRHIFRSEILGAAYFTGSSPQEGLSFVGQGFGPQPAARNQEGFFYVVRGRSFLRYMVRKMTGTLMEVGRGRMKPEVVPALLQLRDRTRSGPTVPPHGLFLHSVEY